MTQRKQPPVARVASKEQRKRDEWVTARPAQRRRSDAIQASVTTEQALMDAYPGSAESLATLAATLGIAWTLADATTPEE